ncbi:hypothetical protein CMI37_29710 [Candidatus Pacearchaeota archaeon]|nr:hypothetical protein [Candidatus Pacearchaeota archaeon]|tara:strand:+ start:539 stop:763 length:225 start_codon:yes stop_codon:yes gene_type:complete
MANFALTVTGKRAVTEQRAGGQAGAILYAIDERGPISLHEIAEATAQSPKAAQINIRKLHKARMIQTAPDMGDE